MISIKEINCCNFIFLFIPVINRRENFVGTKCFLMDDTDHSNPLKSTEILPENCQEIERAAQMFLMLQTDHSKNSFLIMMLKGGKPKDVPWHSHTSVINFFFSKIHFLAFIKYLLRHSVYTASYIFTCMWANFTHRSRPSSYFSYSAGTVRMIAIPDREMKCDLNTSHQANNILRRNSPSFFFVKFVYQPSSYIFLRVILNYANQIAITIHTF